MASRRSVQCAPTSVADPSQRCYPVRMRVSVQQASITDPTLRAHAIVNASNPDVGLGSGVSGAIREACGGSDFQREVRERLVDEFDAPLEVDDCLWTGSGTSKAFRWVLHVPAVNYRVADPETGGPSGPTRVFRCTRAAISEAEHLAREHGLAGKFVLAVPLLGAGHGGLGEVASADAMMSAVAQAALEGTPVGEVRFAVMQERLCKLVIQAADKHGMACERAPRTPAV